MLGLELIEGEAMVKSFTNIEVTVSEGEKQECILASTKGSLLLTNYRLVLLNLQSKPEEVYGIFPIPLAAISNLEIRKHENARIIEVQCKDHRYQRISINPYNDSDNPEDILKALKKNIFPKKLSVRFAFHNKECKVSAEQNGWGLYNPVKEFQRYNISSKYWRECKINQKYKFCASYPATFYVPINVSDKQLIQIAEFRNEGRIPILCWKSPETNATLTRCARQFKRLDRDLIYMSGNNEDADEAIFRGIADSNGGQEVTYFKDFPELDLKESLMRLRALCSHYTSIMKTGEIVNDATWDERLKKTRWLSVGMSLLKYSGKIVAELEAGHSIVVESSDGRDSVSQLISLALLCLDPYYRTITGFAVLVEKEWLSAGHFFGQRSSKKAADHSLSAVFIQFLDCVWQIWDQYPRAFEFNENFLLFLAESVHSSRFGTFLLDCEKQKYADKLREKTPSVWSYTMLHVDRFKNENYPGDSKERILRPRPSAVKLWQQYYLQTTSQLILSRLQPGKPDIKKDATKELSGQTLLEWPVEMLKKADSHRALNISHNKLNNIPISIIPYLRELKVIDLSHNDLTYLSGQFLDLLGKSAEGSIVIRSPSRGSKRSSKSDEKDKLKTVLVCKTQVLDLTENKIISIPLPISNLRGLKWLLLSHNHLGSLPASVGKLTKLRRLHLAHNRLLKLPPELVSLVRLEELVLDHNKLPSLPSDLLKSMPHLQVLTLENNELTSLPVQEFSGFSRLRSLKIGGNPFTFSSSEICSLLGDVSRSGETLRDLSLNGIQLGSYTPVTAPSTPSSSASSAPSSIFQFLRTCKAIKTLDLSNTMIVKDVPEEIFGLLGLTCLKLSNNHICVLPTSISKLEKLEELHLQQNDLQTLPPDVGRLQRLRILDVADNKDLEAIPSQLGYLNLAVLNISGTKALSRFPKEMQAKGHEAMMAYLRLALEGTVDINRMKLMIVGQENVGKTTLITMLKKRLHKKKKLLNTMGSSSGVLPLITSSEKLRRGTSAMNISTDGIDISELQVPLDEARGKATLSVWDFAGQELYYSTHQFFLSDKSLYLLAFNLVDGDEDGRVEYWLQSVAARAGDDAAVILVGTHLDDSSCTQEYLSILTEQLYEKYHRDRPRQGSPRVKWNFGFSHLLFVDCVTGNGIETLIQLLTEVLQGQKHITQTLPSTFLELEKSIVAKRATLNPPILQWAEFADMASLCHIKEERQIAIAAEILHNLGSLLHFEDKELKDLVVIHPQWLTRVMSSIITTKHNYARAGILRHNTLRQIWREPQFPESVHAFLLSLLNRFEISFDLPTEEMTLIPALLDDARPNEVDSLWSLIFQKESSIVRWQDEKKSSQTGSTRRSRKHKTSFGRYYTFDFIPNGLFGRLIVRLLALQKAANIKVLHYWRSGVLVCINHVHRDTLILVELMSKERTITVMVRSLRGGRDVNRSWGTILLAISSLISEWYKLEADIQVPCSHCLEGLAEPYIFPLTTCQQAVISGGGYVYCQGEVQVRLDHVAPDLVMSHLSHKLVNYDDVLLYEELGHGSFATVHRSTYKGEVVAVKRFSFDSPDNTITEEAKIKAFEEFRHEISIMTGLEHPNILKMIGFCLHPVCLVTEYIANGNLYQYIHRLDEPDSDPDAPPKPIIEWNGMSWPLRLKVAKDIAKGMAFLHDLTPPVIHSDLKSPNILLADLSAEAHVVAKVCDFGVSNNVAWSIIGTQVENPVWLAPEVLKGEEYTTKADVYAYGVILWEMLTGQQFMSHIPFMSLIEKSIIAGERSDLPSTCQVPEYVKLIQDCWQDSALHRPSFGEVVLRLMGIMEQSQPQEIATYDEEVIQEIVEKKKKDRVLALHALPAFQYFERLAAETHKWTPPPKESKK